jgi:zinc/manganese transport system permease protein
MDILDLMGAPFAECLVLVAIHTYLGIHVLKRRVIFVDLALAQIAALGTTVGFLFGILPETSAALVFSMAFTFIGAAIFALSRIRGEKVPQEAIIGLVYAITCATAVLVVEKTQGAEHLKDILVGSILWVAWKDVGTAAGAYLFIGIVHFVLRHKFFKISEDPDGAYKSGMWVRFWDFIFYLTFGFVITFSTRVAGVLLVFVFLVAPAIMAFMITNRLLYQLLIGWAMGTAVTVIGLYLSYVVDLPSGPTVVAFYGIALVLGALVLYVLRSKRRLRATAWVGIGMLATVAVSGLLYGGARGLAATNLAASEEVAYVEKGLKRDSNTALSRSREEAGHQVKLLEKATGGCVGPGKLLRYAALPDAQARLDHAASKLKESKRRGLGFLLILLADPETPTFYRSEVVDLLKQAFGTDFGYNPDTAPKDNAEAIARACRQLTALKHATQ